MTGARIAFLLEGSSVTGLGHVIRSLELARAFLRQGSVIEGFVCTGDATARKLLEASGHPVYPSARTTAGISRCVASLKPNAVIIDLSLDMRGLPAVLRRAAPSAVLAVLDSLAFRDRDLDIMINLCNHHPSLGRPVETSTTYVEGPRYAILREAFSRNGLRARERGAHQRDILVSFGGADPCHHTERVLNVMTSLDRLPGAIRVVVGPAFADVESVEQLASSSGRHVHVHHNVRNMAELMSSCLFAFSGCGTTALELCACGIPTLVLAQNRREARFARILETRGAVRLVGTGRAVRTKRIAAEAEAWLRDEQLVARMGRAGCRLVDGRGADRVAALVLGKIRQPHR